MTTKTQDLKALREVAERAITLRGETLVCIPKEQFLSLIDAAEQRGEAERPLRKRLAEIKRLAGHWSEVSEAGDEGTEPIPQMLKVIHELHGYCLFVDNLVASVREAEAALHSAQQEAERLRGALAFYRDEWTVPAIGPRGEPEPTIRLLNDQGRRARQALNTTEREALKPGWLADDLAKAESRLSEWNDATLPEADHER